MQLDAVSGPLVGPTGQRERGNPLLPPCRSSVTTSYLKKNFVAASPSRRPTSLAGREELLVVQDVAIVCAAVGALERDDRGSVSGDDLANADLGPEHHVERLVVVLDADIEPHPCSGGGAVEADELAGDELEATMALGLVVGSEGASVTPQVFNYRH
jgi:hypothetical protein